MVCGSAEKHSSSDTKCGLFTWRPDWLQKFATKKYYMLLYAVIGTLQGMVFSYLTVVLSTIEKRFGLQSKEAAWIYSGNEISQIFFIICLPFIGRVKKRPLFMTLSTCLSTVGLFIVPITHFFGDQLYLSEAFSRHNQSDSSAICQSLSQCVLDLRNPSNLHKDWSSMGVIFFGIFLLGIAFSFYYTLGLSYVDDNSEKSKSPLMISVALASRMLGPAFGYLLGSACLAIYADPWNVPQGMSRSSPDWVGAWWIGFFVIGGLLLLFGPWMALFPSQLPNVDNTDNQIVQNELHSVPNPQSATEWFQEFIVVSRRLLTKPIFVMNLLSSVAYLFGFVGTLTFLPKYFEYHFRMTASTVGATKGLSQSAASVVGILGSGYLITRFRFKARTLATWCILGNLVSLMTFVAMALMRCPPINMHGHMKADLDDRQPGSDLGCSAQCDCSGVTYQPICSQDGITNFLSPCHAGCAWTNRTQALDKKWNTLYWNCSCVSKQSDAFHPLGFSVLTDDQTEVGGGMAVDGYCPVDCKAMFYGLLACMFIVSLLGSSTRVPNFILSLRTLDPRDKTASITLTLATLSLFALLPSPLVFGTVVDSTCLVWGNKCGVTTNCVLYDTDKMRLAMAIYPAVFTMIAMLFDIGVWFYARHLNIYEDGDQANSKQCETPFSDITLDN